MVRALDRDAAAERGVGRRSIRRPTLDERVRTAFPLYRTDILRRSRPVALMTKPPWLPNKEMTKLSEVSDETLTNLFPHFQCLTLQCDPSTLKPRLGGSGPVA